MIDNKYKQRIFKSEKGLANRKDLQDLSHNPHFTTGETQCATV